MKKSVRKILTLALALALICALSVSAFASTPYSLSETFNGCNVDTYGCLQKYNICGQILVEDESARDQYRSVSMEVWYIGEDETGSPVTCKWPSTVSDSRYDAHATATKTWTSAEIAAYNITCMSYANGVFKADVYNGQTTDRFIGGPWYFSYLML